MFVCIAVISPRRMVVLILLAVLVIGGTVFAAATIARRSDDRGAQVQSDSQLMLTAMINQETGARGYFQTRDPVFLEPYDDGLRSRPGCGRRRWPLARRSAATARAPLPDAAARP
jgi:hypothetical protein